MKQLSWGWAFAVLSFAGGVVHGQGVDRSKRPVAGPAVPFRLPTVLNERLPNGLNLRIVEDHSVPVVAVRAVLGADSTLDPAGKEGLFAVTIGAMREATATPSADKLAAAAAMIGTSVTPTSFTTTTGSFGAALSIMGEMLMAPRCNRPRRVASRKHRLRRRVISSIN